MVDFRGLEGTTDFFFIRHGESEGNREHLMQGRRHSRLTDQGRAQARDAGRWFRGRAVACVLSSPLERARETAELVAAEAGLPALEILEDLTELDTGIFTGLSFDEARERHPDGWRTFQLESWEGVPGAERASALYDRAMRVWATLMERRRAGAATALCVTHTGLLQWILKTTFGCRRWMPLLSASENCCVSHLRVANQDLGDGQRSSLASWLMVNLPVGRGSG